MSLCEQLGLNLSWLVQMTIRLSVGSACNCFYKILGAVKSRKVLFCLFGIRKSLSRWNYNVTNFIVFSTIQRQRIDSKT